MVLSKLFKKIFKRRLPTKDIGILREKIPARRKFLTQLPSMIGTLAADTLREISVAENDQKDLGKTNSSERRKAPTSMDSPTAERYIRKTVTRDI